MDRRVIPPKWVPHLTEVPQSIETNIVSSTVDKSAKRPYPCFAADLILGLICLFV